MPLPDAAASSSSASLARHVAAVFPAAANHPNTAKHVVAANSPSSLAVNDGGCFNGQPELLIFGETIVRFVKIPCGLTFCFSRYFKACS